LYYKTLRIIHLLNQIKSLFMKKSFYFIMLASVMALTFGCKKDDADSAKASFSAKVEGTVWAAANITAMYQTGSNATSITTFGTMPSEQITLHFIGSETGTYTFGDLNLASAVIGGNTFTTMFSDNPTGAIVITKYDMTNKKISGTFTFSGDNMDGDVFEVTEGKFENVDLVVM